MRCFDFCLDFGSYTFSDSDGRNDVALPLLDGAGVAGTWANADKDNSNSAGKRIPFITRKRKAENKIV